MTAYTETRDQLLDAALIHVAFDGWSEVTFRAAARDVGIDMALARAVCPRGAVDLALAFHHRGDARMLERISADPLPARIRDKITAAIRYRIEAIEDKEAVRRGATLFALPMHAADGAGAVWETADKIWIAIGDTSEDVNWYTKRATLSGVYSATVLYWLGDDSPDSQNTWEFLDRRIEDVMQIEKFKAQARDNAFLKTVFAGPVWLMGQIKAPSSRPGAGMPGRWQSPRS